MNNVANFVRSMLPRIDKKAVKQNLENLRKELMDQTVPPFKTATEIMKDWRWKDRDLERFNQNFVKGVDSRFKGNVIEVSYEIMNRCLENINVLEKLVDNEYSNDILRSAMTYSQTQLLQYIEAVNFAAKYARMMLIHVLATEADLYRQNNMVDAKLSPAEMRWLQDNRHTYIFVMKALDATPRDLEKTIKEIPAIKVDPENAEAAIRSVGINRLDPFSLGMAGIVLNPIYHIRMVISEWEVARYEAAKEERKMLEYQLMDLKNALDGKDDPKVQQAIEYTQDRIKRLNYKIAKMEEDNG